MKERKNGSSMLLVLDLEKNYSKTTQNKQIDIGTITTRKFIVSKWKPVNRARCFARAYSPDDSY